MTKDEALKLALEALEALHDENMDYLTRNKLGGENNQCMVFARETITAIKEALAQLEHIGFMDSKLNPIQRTWVGLTDEEILVKCESVPDYDIGNHDLIQFARAIEAKLKAKNT